MNRAAGVPGPRGLPLVGVAPAIAADPLGYLERARERWGSGVVFLPAGRFSFYLVNEPELIERVLVTDNRHYRKDHFARQVADDLLGDGILTSDGAFWLRQRRLAQPAFHRERIASYGAMMVEATERYVERVRTSSRRDLHADMMELTREIVTRTLFSTTAKLDPAEAGEALAAIVQRYEKRLSTLVPALSKLPLPANLRFAAARRRLDEVIFAIIDERRRRPASASAHERADLLDLLLAARDDDGQSMTDVQLRNEVVTLFVAGQETTGLLLLYTLTLLSAHPSVLAKLHAELDQVLQGRSPTVADVPRLEWCEKVVRESLRIHPTAWAFGRIALDAVELGGHRLPAGSHVVVSPWVMHRDPRFFTAPLEFRPERWNDDLEKRLPRFAYFPFGGGPRVCIGNEFARLETILVLAALLQRLDVRVEAPESLRFAASVTLRPRGRLFASLRERSQPSRQQLLS